MTLSDRDRRLLDEMARRLEEQEPELAWALKDWSEPPAVRRATSLVRWRERFGRSKRGPLLAAGAVGAMFVVGQLMAGANAPTPAPERQADVTQSTLASTPL